MKRQDSALGPQSGHDAFSVDDVMTGPYAHGFGNTGDGRTYAFVVRGQTLTLDIYREDLTNAVPGPSDVEAVAELSVTEIDLADERSVVGAVRDAVARAQPIDTPTDGATTIRAWMNKLGSVIDPL